MSLFARPSITLAIVFGCFVVLIPRILLPYFRPRAVHHTDDYFRRSSPTPSPINHPQENVIEPIADSLEPSPDFVRTDELLSKSTGTFILPMYVVGITVFLLYTCFKYFGNRQSQEQKIRSRYSSSNIQWNSQQKKFNYQMNNRHTIDDDQEEEDESYAGLDADYVEYLKQRRRDEREREQALTTEQKQMHNTLDEMKHSLSFINSKLGANTSNMSLTNNEITQLQNRLAQTEAQMYKILSALDAASSKMNQITQNTRTSFDQPSQRSNYDDDYHQSSKSLSQSEEEEDDDDSSSHDEEQGSFNETHQKQDLDDESESSYEEDEDEVSHEYEDDESESSSDRYGLMTTNYGCEPSTVDDYDLDEIKKPEETTDSQTKVQEWRQRHHSQSLSSNHSSVEDNDQAIPTAETEEKSELRRRKHQHDE